MKGYFKLKWKFHLLQGITFAVLMAGFNLLMGDDFSILKFIYHLTSLSILMGGASYYDFKKKNK